MSGTNEKSIRLTNSVYVGGNVGGNIFNITGSNSYTLAEDLTTILNQIRSDLERMPLSEESKAEIVEEIETIEAQMNSPRPESPIVVESLRTIRNIIEGIVGNAAYAILLKGLEHLILEVERLA
ncbi:MAG: hypothetical protein KatS3mg053_3054 [Candidatus Roseilinea sp.]|nr:MAG: hypothetical protein KatS3mg053_3054 [Candidatus Roseilinea sp.]